MAKTYSMDFKLEAYDYFLELQKDGFCYPNGVQVKNVRDLCRELEISSYSLYKWIPQMEALLEKERNEPKEPEIPYQANKNVVSHTKQEIKEIEQNAVRKYVFSLRSLGSLASALNISGYSSMSVENLKLFVGVELIKESGLVDTIKREHLINDNERTFVKIEFTKHFGDFKDLPAIVSVGIIRESNKAILIKWNENHIWIPKSCFKLLKII